MKKDFRHLEWNQQDRRRQGQRNTVEYQKAMRCFRRAGIPADLADKAAINAGKTWPLSIMGGSAA